MDFTGLSVGQLETWLRETDPSKLELLWQAADTVRQQNVGDAIHLRGLIEISNYCTRSCGYCGLRAGNSNLERYRMTSAEVLDCTLQAVKYGYGTVVLQAGEDPGLTTAWVTDVVRRIKAETPLAVTLSLGERTVEELAAWREAGADRYLLRFETSDPQLYAAIHPGKNGTPSHPDDRLNLLRKLKQLGYEAGSGIMLGLPGQTYSSVAKDLAIFRELDLDMVGIGPYIAHANTPLGSGSLPPATPSGQISGDELSTFKAMALTRLVCPSANIPSTTALATLNLATGRELGLQRGANVMMPNLTPIQYRALYEIYPDKACTLETAKACHSCMQLRILGLGRHPGSGQGGRRTGQEDQMATDSAC